MTFAEWIRARRGHEETGQPVGVEDFLAFSRLPVAEQMGYWDWCAKHADQNGAPVDLMYIKLRDRGVLPPVMEADGTVRFVSSEEFESGVKDCVRIRQAGGIERVIARLAGSPVEA